MFHSTLPNPGHLMMFKKATHTRWLSHQASITALMSCLPCIVSWFVKSEALADPIKGAGIAKLINTFFFIRTVYMMAKVLPHLTLCSVGLQGKKNDFSTAIARTKQCITQLEQIHNDRSLPEFDKKYVEFEASSEPPAFPRNTGRVAVRHFDDEPEAEEGVFSTLRGVVQIDFANLCRIFTIKYIYIFN